MIKDDCIFCKLANGIFPTNSIYEDDDFKVILDINPSVKGHSLVIPKNHCDNALTADEKTLAGAANLAAKTARVMKKALKCDGINIIQNNGEAAGQTVFHLHFHVIPRYRDDNLNINWEHMDETEENLKSTAQLLSAVFIDEADNQIGGIV